MRRLLTLACFLASLGNSFLWSQPHFQISVADSLAQTPILRHALEDFRQLLGQAFPKARFNKEGSPDVVFVLLIQPDTAETRRFARDYPMAEYPPHSFTWQGGQGFYQLTSPSVVGLQFGLYSFLQDQLGFRFYHPRQTLIPQYGAVWPLKDFLPYQASPVFLKKGFHLHTTHPLELTEAFHGTGFSGGVAEIQEYIDWLCRNGQNYFDFTLMRQVDLVRWPRYAAQFVEYAHQRGLLVGLEISLHMVQQQVFQLVKYPHQVPLSLKKQIDRCLKLLFQARWDFLNLDLTTAEFFGGLDRQKTRLKNYLVRQVRDRYGAQVLLRKHVVNEENHVGRVSRILDVTSQEDKHIGILLHTVMFYALTDSLAPVYENQDFSHVLRDLVRENRRRETWYYPESAYWITFDNSVPMLLLPYLKARYNDIRTCDSLGIANHVTFSSGWEWGYALVDWCIARWSWKINGRLRAYSEPLRHMFGEVLAHLLQEAEKLQFHYLKRLNLMRYVCPLQTIDELPRFLRKSFQPRPEWEPRHVFKADTSLKARMHRDIVEHLRDYAHRLQEYARIIASTEHPLAPEISDALLVTAMRALHRSATWKSLMERHVPKQRDEHLEEARKVRQEALHIVHRQELRYRYPVYDIARPHASPTAYPYGYLWPVHNLHFWLREEEQIRRGRFGPFFMNIWPLGRILGVD
ncbi:MAG: hypothetical protein N2050_02410 [Flavobacteriales bacterium]|nr:hypothetical protein [Flavobacteriales bacterium]